MVTKDFGQSGSLGISAQWHTTRQADVAKQHLQDSINLKAGIRKNHVETLFESHSWFDLFGSILRCLWSDYLDSISGVEPSVLSSVQHAFRLLINECCHTRGGIISATDAVTGLQSICKETGSTVRHLICHVSKRLTALLEKPSFDPRNGRCQRSA